MGLEWGGRSGLSTCRRRTGVQTLSSSTNAGYGDSVTLKLSLGAGSSWEDRQEGPGAPGLDKITRSMFRVDPDSKHKVEKDRG